MIYKRLLNSEEKSILINSPVTDAELLKRETEYPALNSNKFGFNRSKEAFHPVSFQWNGKVYELQYNTCSNPLCKNHGLPQERFSIKSKPSRFKLHGEGYKKILDVIQNELNQTARQQVNVLQ
ncbi:hypothetical protein [Psychrobacillus glaciei]|uniref:hypothetical protein n=1 Tax=Psychrobacillus glaciei TaxID=2283160 RepID=UPI001CEF7537|nr:hypothetical protein [Psychrobacillus glaciei]